MKFFIVFAAALAVASAGHLVTPIAYSAQHLPVIGPNGVPVDTPAVQQATAAHLAHKAEAHARNGDYAVYAHAAPIVAAHTYAAAPVVAAATPIIAKTYASAPVVAAAAPVIAKAVPAAYPTTLGVPAVTANGVPLETPEVVAAKSNHFAAHAEALARNSPIYAEAAPVIAATYAAAPVAAVAAAPVAAYSTYAAAPVAAYSTYAAAPVASYSYSSYASAPVVAQTYAAAAPVIAKTYAAVPAAYSTTLGVPAVTANGVPLDTPEVAAAKANHLAAHAEAAARNAW